ncbi:hypothetical protein CEXT_395691 [Caerostris extrusa]|uniref:Uncharacterized protein n=1 Tax=Caerostris extrusa TaxID=172846 RepID=A0AAV4V0Y0_CAEEX|nr:hypothetical protein CEXT_395691 [Caerostris extrusa]
MDIDETAHSQELTKKCPEFFRAQTHVNSIVEQHQGGDTDSTSTLTNQIRDRERLSHSTAVNHSRSLVAVAALPRDKFGCPEPQQMIQMRFT